MGWQLATQSTQLVQNKNITTAGIALVKAAAVVVEELLEDNLHPGEVGVVELLELRNPGNDMEQVLPLSLLPS